MKKNCGVVSLLGMVCILCVITTLVFAQAPDTLWTKTYGGVANDMGYDVERTSEGGYVITGWTQSFGAGGYDVYLIKTDANGNILWEKTYGGSEEEMGWSVIQTLDGGYIIAGYTCSFGNGDADVYLIKTDSLGDTLWTKTYGGDSTDSGYSLTAALDGGFVIAGRTQSSGAGSDDIYLIKIDSLGNLAWQKTYGGPGRETAYSIQKLYDGGYIIAGYTTSFGVVGEDAYVVRTDSNGDSLWTHTYGDTSHDLISHVESTQDSGFIMIGFTLSFAEGDYYIIRTNGNGDTIWTRNFGGEMTEWGYTIRETNDSNYVCVGWSDSYYPPGGNNIYFLKINHFGDTLWTGLYGGDNSDAAFDLEITSDGGYIIVGSTDSYGAGGEDVYLIKTEPDVGVEEKKTTIAVGKNYGATIFSGPLLLPEDKKCKVFDITGRVVEPNKITRGVYFIEIDGEIVNKVIKIK